MVPQVSNVYTAEAERVLRGLLMMPRFNERGNTPKFVKSSSETHRKFLKLIET